MTLKNKTIHIGYIYFLLGVAKNESFTHMLRGNYEETFEIVG